MRTVTITWDEGFGPICRKFGPVIGMHETDRFLCLTIGGEEAKRVSIDLERIAKIVEEGEVPKPRRVRVTYRCSYTEWSGDGWKEEHIVPYPDEGAITFERLSGLYPVYPRPTFCNAFEYELLPE